MTGSLRPLTPSQRAHVVAKLVRMERATNDGVPAPRLLARRFFSARRALYPFADFPPASFLDDWEIETRLLRINPPDAVDRLTDKLALHRLGIDGTLPVSLPRLLAVVRDGAVVEGRWRGEAAIAKPRRGSGGAGVVRLLPGDPLPGGSELLLEAPVASVPAIGRVFPGALSTVRVVTARDAGGVFVLGAAHRFATAASLPTDNFKRGGIVAAVHPATGALSEAVLAPAGRARRTARDHPDTGVPIAGLAVPRWHAVRDAALRAMDAFPTLRYAGWDFAVTGRGPVLIEANAALPNPNLIQAHRPLLSDRRARDFFTATGVIGARRARAAGRAVG